MPMSRRGYYDYYFSSEEIEGSAARIRALNELVYGRISPHVMPGSPVLELGVGKGFFAWICRDHGHDYLGVEANGEQCARLKKQGLDVICAQVPPLPPELEDEYGLIYAAHLLEHLPGSRAVHELLSQCRDRLAGGGAVAMLFPDAESMGSDFWNCDYTHTYATTGRRIAQAMTDAGLRVVTVQTFNGHYRGGRRLLARAGSSRLVRSVTQALAREPARRERYYRGWLYLQKTILVVGKH